MVLAVAPPPAMSSSSLITSHGLALVTAVAVSGTLLLIALCRQTPFSLSSSAAAPAHPPPSSRCRRSSSSGETAKKQQRRWRQQQQQKKKRVHFAEEVVEFGDGARISGEDSVEGERKQPEERRRMPANRVALYNGILRDRVRHRMSSCRGY